MRWAAWVLFVFLLLLQPACGTIEVSKASIPLGLGLDYQDKHIITSVQFANPLPSEKSGGDTPRFTVISSEGVTLVDSARKMTLSTSQTPLWSHAALYVFGEDFAKNDFSMFADFIARNRFVRKNIPVVVAHNCTAEQLLNVKPLIESYTATAIRDLLQTQETQLGIYTQITILELLDRLASPGREPVIPMVTIDKSGAREVVKLDGMAVIKGRKMIGTLDENQSRGYRYLRPQMIEGGLFLIPSPTDAQGWVSLEMSRSQLEISPQVRDDRINMHIEIKAEGNFYEQTGTGDLFSLEMFKILNTVAAQEIESEIRSCIDQAQGLNCDFLGWGQLIQAEHPELWAEMGSNWDQVFPLISSDIEVEFEIRRSYLTNKSFVFRD